MKKAILRTVLVLLLVAELYLCTTLLPMRWEHAIDQVLFRLLPPDHWAITHPALDLEIDQVLQGMPGVRFALDMFFLSWLALNTYLIVKVWKALRRGRRRKEALPDQTNP